MESQKVFMDKKLRNQLVITIIAGCLLTVLTGFITSYEVSSKKAIENNLLLQQNCDMLKIHQDKFDTKVDKAEFNNVIQDNKADHNRISDKLDKILLKINR